MIEAETLKSIATQLMIWSIVQVTDIETITVNARPRVIRR
jgi:hypothetical protein